MLKIIIILISFSSLFSQHINNETGWEFNSSPLQSFYIFDTIQIDGSSAQGDGWAPSTTIQSECIDNPFTCDVLGAFINNVCVGWVYADIEGFTTLPIMGTNDINPPNNTDGYCQEGDIPEILIYDSSSGSILEITAGDNIPGWSENYVHQIQNISFANNGITNQYTQWNYFQSSNQAFYIFENIIYGDDIQTEFDVIGAFKNNLCVGWINLDPNGFTAVPVMGVEDGLYPNYMEDDDIPEFKIYDFSEDEYYNINLDDSQIPGWSSNGYFIIYGDTPTLPETILGCTDLEACNYSIEANTDDGSCYYCFNDNCEDYPQDFYDCNGDCIVELDCLGVCGGTSEFDECGVCGGDGIPDDECDCDGNIEDCFGECGGTAELDECGECNGNNACLLANLSLGSFDYTGTLEILYDFGGPVAGFQFNITGLALIDGSGGAAEDAGLTVSTGGSTVLGYSLNNSEISAGTGLLTVLSFSSITDASTVLSMDWDDAITDGLGNIYDSSANGNIDHGEPDCLGLYYGDAFIDDCGECVPSGTNPDDCLSSDLGIPDELYLGQNYPNPFNPISNINYGISDPGNVDISLYNLNGRKVIELINSFHPPGYYSLTLNSKNLNSSIYILKLVSSNQVRTKKIAVVK